ncbi:MAG: hypothetical protein H6Q72_4205 [Firmicutes bacterium]|nr:hypothetical protein [Bacillota bacterium]
MAQVTMKCFQLIHEKMLASKEYKLGYHTETEFRGLYRLNPVSRLRELRTKHLLAHNQFSAGRAMVILEVIYETERQGVDAA